MGGTQLLFLRDGEEVLRFPIGSAQVFIGRNITNDIVLSGDGIPEVAAVLIEKGTHRYSLRDLTQGAILVEGKPLEVEEVDLTTPCAFTVGPFTIRVEPASESTSTGWAESTSPLAREPADLQDAWLHHRGRRYRISPSKAFAIGADETNDLILDDTYVSLFHCRITHRDQRWIIEDLGSTNGTLVNGFALRSGSLELGSPTAVQLGREELSIQVQPNAEPPWPVRAPRMMHGMIAENEGLRSALGSIDAFARQSHPVIVIGETGTGKELVARALHDASDRRGKPFLALNCSAINATLIESELFGHMKGAFTGADAQKAGAFEAASGGTMFLDEIGELPIELQPKLLRVLESSAIRRVGDTRDIKVDARIVVATHRNLEALMAAGRFREDLFHRLFVLPIHIPPLRERPEDLLPLAYHFIHTSAPERLVTLSLGAEERVEGYDWPGNVRELRNVITRAIVQIKGDVIQADDLRFWRDSFALGAAKDARASFFEVENADRARLMDALEKTGGNRMKAAELLGISRSTLYLRMKRYGLTNRDD